MTEFKIKSESFDWNDNLSEVAQEDFDCIRNKLSYGVCQSIGMALAKLEMLEKQGCRVRMTLDEAIKLYEEKAEEMENKSRKKNDGTVSTSIKYKKCASEHRQLAEWLRELKFYKDRQDLINKSWQELIGYKERIEKIKMRSQAYRERGEAVLASGMEQALDILRRGEC